MENSSLISVVIPVYNNENVINETLDSVIRQTYNNWEVLCVDDGSSDSTAEIIHRYCQKDSRIKYVLRSEYPKGGSHCRNIGLQNATGKYIIFLDGDDILFPECLDNRLKVMKSHNYDFAVFPMSMFQGNKHIRKTMNDPYVKDYKSAFASVHAAWQVTQPIYRTEFVKNIGGFDIEFQRLQDIEFGLRAIVSSKGNFKTFFHQQCDCNYRLSNSKATAKKYNIALMQYDRFWNLVLKLHSRGAFPSKRIFSKIVLCILLSAYMVHSVPEQLGEKPCMERAKIFEDHNLKNFLMPFEHFLLSFILIFDRLPSMQSKLLWFIRRLLMIVCFR